MDCPINNLHIIFSDELSTSVSTSDSLDPSIFLSKDRNDAFSDKEMDGRGVYFPPESAFSL